MKPIEIRVSRKKLRALKLLVFGVGLLWAIFLVDSRLRPMITTIAQYQAKLAVTETINQAVLEILSQEDMGYDKIIALTEDEQGQVRSISTDMRTVNRLKAEVSNQVSNRLMEASNQSVLIPLGTILGGEYFSGRGPEIEFQVLPTGYVETDFYNQFQSAGINQTLHQIMLSVRVTVAAVAPLYTSSAQVDTNICVAETVIVGEVPEAFTDINGDRSDLIGLYNDYGAEKP